MISAMAFTLDDLGSVTITAVEAAASAFTVSMSRDGGQSTKTHSVALGQRTDDFSQPRLATQALVRCTSRQPSLSRQNVNGSPRLLRQE